jgi:hypothetical protein
MRDYIKNPITETELKQMNDDSSVLLEIKFRLRNTKDVVPAINSLIKKNEEMRKYIDESIK